MPTYTGAGRTSNYLRKHDLHCTARNNSKITLFFKPRSKQTRKNNEQDFGISKPPPKTPEPIPQEPFVNSESANPPSVDTVDMTYEATPEHTQVTTTHDVATPAATFLDVTEDDDDAVVESVSVLETVKKLIIDAKKYKLFTSLFYLTSLKQFIDLWEKYKQNPQIRAPTIKASHVITISVGKGPYMARKIRSLYRYVACFRTLPLINASKHYSHPSLLNNKRIVQAVRRYLTVLSDGTVRFFCTYTMAFPHTYLSDHSPFAHEAS